MPRTVHFDKSTTAYFRLRELSLKGVLSVMPLGDVHALVRDAYGESAPNLVLITKIWRTTDPDELERHSGNSNLHYALVSNPHTSETTKRKIGRMTNNPAVKVMIDSIRGV